MDNSEEQKQAVYGAIRQLEQSGIKVKLMKMYGSSERMGLALSGVTIEDFIEVTRVENPILARHVA